jgi:hypothetical protein
MLRRGWNGAVKVLDLKKIVLKEKNGGRSNWARKKSMAPSLESPGGNSFRERFQSG